MAGQVKPHESAAKAWTIRNPDGLLVQISFARAEAPAPGREQKYGFTVAQEDFVAVIEEMQRDIREGRRP